jgi:hypothetical protein
MFRFQRYIMPAIAALVVVALGVTLVIFNHSAPHHAVADDPTATVVPTDTATPAPTDTPVPTATPEPTDTPLPTATPEPAPGKLVINGKNPTYYYRAPNPTGDPALDGYGEKDTQVINTGGRLVYWTMTSPANGNTYKGTVAPGETANIGYEDFAVDIIIKIAWSDHVSASGNLTAQILCQAPTP